MKRIVFNNSDQSFFSAASAAVDEYFQKNNIKKTGNWGLYLKTGLFICSALIAYFILLFGHYSGITGSLLCISFGLALSAIAINVMHDACHGSFSDKKWINKVMGLTMNMLGSNAFLWKIKHNVLHHTYTNIDGMDNDIDNWPLLRQSPAQKRKRIHRFQFLYMFLLYAVSTIEWMLIGDFTKYFKRKISSMAIKKISVKEHLLFWFSKVFYVAFYIMIPAWILGWQNWLIGFLIVHITMGLTLTILFQLAHVVGNTHFEVVDAPLASIAKEWAVHEVITTSNFAIHNKLISWLAGGLNFQIEHHLFPRISHVHYPALSRIIRKACDQYQLPYNCYPTITAALISHIRFMKKLGKEN